MANKEKSLREINFQTSIDITGKSRKDIIDILNVDLAATSDLYSQIKQAHWNVKGANFHQLHLLFDELAEEILEFVDTIAERVTAMGGYAMGTARMAAKNSYLPEYLCHSSEGLDHVRDLSAAYSMYSRRVREMIDSTAELGDMSTSDLYTEVSRAADKHLWLLEAHLQ